MSTSDPANVYSQALTGVDVDALARPRGRGAHIVTVGGIVVLSSESCGKKIAIREGTDPEILRGAVDALLSHLTAARGVERRQDVIMETINGEPAAGSEWASQLRDAGLRNDGRSLRYYAPIR